MTEMLFYQKPTMLTREQHQGLRFKPCLDFSFAAAANSVPATGVEFFEASRDFAILFNKDPQGEFFPLLLMSLKQDRNVQIDSEGKWSSAYIPAFIRRYPFAHSRDNRVCFDAAATANIAVDLKDGEPLFSEQREETDTLKNILRFLREYNQESQRTREFCAALKENELLQPFNVQLMKGQQAAVRLEGLYAIDEKRLNALDDAKITEWFRKGWIAWCYAHLHSLGTLTRLMEVTERALAETNSAGAA